MKKNNNFIILLIILNLVFFISFINCSSNEIDVSDYKSIELNEDTIQTFISSPNPTIVYYYTKSKESQKFLSIFLNVADEYLEENNDIEFGVINIDKQLNARSRYSIEASSVIYYNSGREMVEFQGDRSKKSFEYFLQDPLSVPPPYHGPLGWHKIESQVAYLSDRNYTSFLFNNEHVLVMFFDPNCAFCKNSKLAYAEASMEVVDKKLGRFASLDCSLSKRVCDILNIAQYPTFLYFHKGQNTDAYLGSRSEEDFTMFLDRKVKESNPSKEESEELEEQPQSTQQKSPTVTLNRKVKREL